MNATMALLTEYGKYFGQAQPGSVRCEPPRRTRASPATSTMAGRRRCRAVHARALRRDRWRTVRVGAAGPRRQRDAAQQFGMNALDWSNISQYWSAKFVGDYRIAVRYGELLTHYDGAVHGAGRISFDDDLDI